MVQVAAASALKPRSLHGLKVVSKLQEEGFGSPSRFAVLQDLQESEERVSDLEGVAKPWSGPLPSPRRSPLRTLGDAVSSALQGEVSSFFPASVSGSRFFSMPVNKRVLPVSGNFVQMREDLLVSSSDPVREIFFRR
jgi:hypothetical protein